MSALAWDRVSLTIGGKSVLDNVSLRAAAGEVLGLVGPNGAGKTALLRCAAGLQPRHGGTIRVADEDLLALPAQLRARRVAYLPQSRDVAWPLSVEDTVALGRIPHHGRGRNGAVADATAIAAALSRVGLAPLAQRRIDTLSGGELALVLLARALAVEAPVLLLDEPCAALDPRHQLAAMSLFRRLAADGACVCVVLHDLALASRFCDRVAVLDHGRLVADGPPEAALDDATLARVYGIVAARSRLDDDICLVPWTLVPDPASRAGGYP
jgi:iron complex transport system ATP-binding protein